LGTAISLNDPAVVEALASVVDFLWIDLEHNPIGIETLMGHLVAARAGGTPALVRVPSSDVSFLKRVLDTGAEGIIVPQVRSAEEVLQVVRASRYPPLGARGWGPRRSSDFGRRSQAQIVREANEELFVAVQIENTDAVQALDDIVAVQGLDALVVGPYDLSASLGLLGRIDHPKVLSIIESVVKTAHEAGLTVGVGDAAAAESIIRWAKMGADWIQGGSDVAYMTCTAEKLFFDVRAGSSR
jgi:2-dehydro-3-deoxyglucarate aldolase/4-hydroxy-2-oxoheptanedioate aldolase